MSMRAVKVVKLIRAESQAIRESEGRLDQSPFYQDVEALEGVVGHPALDSRWQISLDICP